VTAEREKIAISRHEGVAITRRRSGKDLVVIRIAHDARQGLRLHQGGKELIFRSCGLRDGRCHSKPVAKDFLELAHEMSARDDREVTAKGAPQQFPGQPSEENGRDEDVRVEQDAHLARAAAPSALRDDTQDVRLGNARTPRGLRTGGEDTLPSFEARDVLAEGLAQ